MFWLFRRLFSMLPLVKTMLVGENTDLIVLLRYHVSLDFYDLFFCPEPKKNTKILCLEHQSHKRKLGQDICNNILFIHAILGCDTTSSLYGIGKGMSLSKFNATSMFHEQAKVFHSNSAPIHDVIDAEEKALVLVYDGMLTDTLDSL